MVRALAPGMIRQVLAVFETVLRYRSTRRSYWKTKRADWIKMDTWEWTVETWNSKFSRQCPECWYAESRLAHQNLAP
jgi:hypothetical protein